MGRKMKKSIFKPLIEEGMTTLKIRYDWKQDKFRFEAMKEWEKDIDFSTYNSAFYMDGLLTDDIRYLNTAQVKELYGRYNLDEYLDTVTKKIREGKHFGMECYYYAKRDIRIICCKHSRKTGNNNRRDALYMDGIRRCEPEDDELEMITIGLNISRGMSFKLLAAGLPFGGSKTMVQMSPIEMDDMEAIGFIGYVFDKTRCATGADLNIPTALADVENEYFSMNFTSGPKSPLGESGRPTAYGVYKTLKKAVLFKEGTEILNGKSIVLMGLGAVGWYMGEHFLEEDVKLYVADIDNERVRKFIDSHPERDIEAVNAEEALYMDVDIICPCAVGNLINKDNVDSLKCSYIWGSANNQIQAAGQEEEILIAELLAKKNIMFQAEWWYNTGGVLCAGQEYLKGEHATYENLIKVIEDTLPNATWSNLNEAKRLGITPTENAYRVCREFIYEE